MTGMFLLPFLKFSWDTKKINENNGPQIQMLCCMHLNRHLFHICPHWNITAFIAFKGVILSGKTCGFQTPTARRTGISAGKSQEERAGIAFFILFLTEVPLRSIWLRVKVSVTFRFRWCVPQTCTFLLPCALCSSWDRLASAPVRMHPGTVRALKDLVLQHTPLPHRGLPF